VDILRRAANPWDQEVLLGIGWDLFWWAVAAGAVFVVVHTLLVWRLSRRAATRPPTATPGGAADATAVPPRVVRHSLGSRLFHWSMALAMLVLLGTAFVPVMGFRFDWVTIHWVAGLVLIATVAYHVVRATFFQSPRAIWVGARDVREGARELRHLLGVGEAPLVKPGKYAVGNKLYHHGAAAATLAAIATGVLMMVRIDTPLFTQDPYLLGDATWGMVYVLHGAAGVLLVLMVIAHVYFAVRPEKRWQTRAMIKGWITREEYLEEHDTSRWPLPAGEGSGEGEPATGDRVPVSAGG